MRVVYPDSLFTILNRVCLPRFSLYNPKEGLFNPDSSFKPMKRLFFTTILHSQPLIGLYMDNSSKNTKNHPNLESCGKIRENGLFSGEFADKKRKWKSKSCSEDLFRELVARWYSSCLYFMEVIPNLFFVYLIS